MKDDNANYDYSSVPMAGLPMIGALMGMCLGGPVGILAGVKIGGLAAVGGSILGYTGASVVSEQKELREYIDEHYEQQPELFVQTPMEEALAKRRSSRSLPELPGPETYFIYYYSYYYCQVQTETAGERWPVPNIVPDPTATVVQAL